MYPSIYRESVPLLPEGWERMWFGMLPISICVEANTPSSLWQTFKRLSCPVYFYIC